jgi:hypothetical protein
MVKTNAKINSPYNPKAVYLNGKLITTGLLTEKTDDIYFITINSNASKNLDISSIEFRLENNFAVLPF